MEKIKTIIVDDEEEAREGMRMLVERDKDIELIAVCENGVEAIHTINEKLPQLVFLDIQMPEVNGFDVLNSIQIYPVPAIIFATAYDQYAVKAFDMHAVDYLLKPFTNKRFFESLNKVKEHLNSSSLQKINQQLTTLLQQYEKDKTPASDTDELIHDNTTTLRGKLVIKSSGKICFINMQDIIWIEAYDCYIKIHVEEKFFLVRESMKSIETKLSTSAFVRIHKSSMVNVDYIKELEPYFNGEFLVKLINGTSLKLSRGYKQGLMGRLNIGR